MRAVLLAMGSRGDVEPLLALAGGLADAGHTVRLVVARDLTGLVTDRRVEVGTFPVDVISGSREGVGLDWQAGADEGVRQEYRLMRALGRELAEPIAEGVLTNLEDADIVVSGGMTYDAASVVTRARDVPHVLALMAPTTPALDGASTTHAVRADRRSPLNSLSSLATAVSAYRIFRPAGEIVRRRLGRRPGRFLTYLRDAYRTPILLAASPAVVPPAREWRGRLEVTGYWARGVPQDWEPPQELLDFLAAGPAPVYVGFGSMASRDPAGTTASILAAIRRAGVRALVGSGWADLRSDALPEGVHLVGDVPHVADQPYWGRRVRDLGTGPAPIPRHELGADRLTVALTELGSPARRSRAAGLGQVIRAEDGVATAVQRLQSLAG